MKRPVEVVRLPRRRAPAPPSAPLPEPVLSALASIAGDLRHLPRDCIGDAAELLHWLRRMAARVDGVGRMRVAGALPKPARPAGIAPPAASKNGTSLAEAVFGAPPTTGDFPVVGRNPPARTITSRRGRTVRVEVRRARAAGQMELWS